MNITPSIAASQIASAREERAQRGPSPVYSTSTGDAPLGAYTEWDRAEDERARETQAAFIEYLSDPHCFVCQRHTDHWGEHDDMVDAGTARYDKEGNVYPVPWRWDN